MSAFQVGDRLQQRAGEDFIGRAREIDQLMGLLDGDGPVVAHVHGIGGIGKTALLARFAAEARRQGASVVQLDGRSVEPTEKGFLGELRSAIGGDHDDADSAAQRLAELPDPVILIVDTYEVLRLLDTWLRQSFVPSLRAGVHVLLAGREPPVSGWFTTPGWRGSFLGIRLESLPEESALELLSRFDVGTPLARRLNRFTHGHPLALKLAAAAVVARPDLDLEDTFSQGVVEELAKLYLDDVDDPLTRRTLEAASVVRRVTRSLLGALVPDAAPSDLDDRLRDLPFVENARDGLVVHDVVREAISSSLHGTDPARYRSLRHAAWMQLRQELGTAGPADLWRYTADMLYLVENPVIREAFFPSDHLPFAAEPARTEHRDSIMDIAEKCDGPESASHLARWWSEAPDAFRVIVDRVQDVSGFYAMFDTASLPRSALARDPVLAPVCTHLADDALPAEQRALVLRKWLSREDGESPSPVQACAWLDVKRTYLEMRDVLRHVYVVAWDVAPYAGVLPGLGFRFLEGATPVDDRDHRVAVLDFGPDLVSGWMSGIVGAELGVEVEDIFDERSRELIIEGERIRLTLREFEVMRYLWDREPEVATRSRMLADIWGNQREGASNVVDVVVRSLRRKLGTRAGCVETVRGVGYRYRPALSRAT